MAHRWFTRGVLTLVAVFLVLTLVNATRDGDASPWRSVGIVAATLAVLLALGPGRLR